MRFPIVILALVFLATCGSPNPEVSSPPVSVEVGVASVLGGTEEGLYPPESHEGSTVRWTSGEARIVVPNDLTNPAQSMSVAVWPFRGPGVSALRVLVNRDVLYEGNPEGEWSQTFDLGAYAESPSLQIELLSDSGAPSGDGRVLGFPIKSVQITTAH